MDSGVVTVVRARVQWHAVETEADRCRSARCVTPAARSAASSRKVVVVLPLVPVTAYIVIASAGRP